MEKQAVVSWSSAESEYRALPTVVAEICWLHSLLADLFISIKLPVEVHCDNISATYLAANPINHVRTKHLEVDLHFIRE